MNFKSQEDKYIYKNIKLKTIERIKTQREKKIENVEFMIGVVNGLK